MNSYRLRTHGIPYRTTCYLLENMMYKILPCTQIFFLGFTGVLAVFPLQRCQSQQVDPARVVGFEKCGKCHAPEIETWKATPHHTTFQELHRNPAAKEIAEKLGVSSIKRNDTCIQCHYTQQNDGGKAKAIAGISCESCHGGAKGWLEIHADYGGPQVTRDQETPAHRQQRVEASIAQGMNNPENLYLIARKCYNCHTVPNEKLVNVGGHVAGSADFELVTWSQGMVRHNFLRAGGKSNVPSSVDRLRLMYVVGQIAELENSLRATAEATQKARYGSTSAKRVASVRTHLTELQQVLKHPMLAEVLEIAGSVKLKMNNGKELNAAAEKISAIGIGFASDVDGSILTAVDPYLPSPEKYKQVAHQK